MKAKKNRNGKVGVNKKNDFASSPSASRKLCNNCDSAGHLTHACTKVKVKTVASSSMPAMPNMPSFHEPCGIIGCMPCAFLTMSEFFKSYHANASTCTDTKTSMSNEHVKAKTVVPPKPRKVTPVSKSDDSLVKTDTEKETVDMKVKHVKVNSNVDPVTTPKPLGPKHVWVPKSS